LFYDLVNNLSVYILTLFKLFFNVKFARKQILQRVKVKLLQLSSRA